MSEDIHVRVATPEDFQAIMRLATMVAEENGILSPNMELIAGDIWPAIHQDHGLVGVIGAPGKELEGFVLLRIGNMWYSTAPIIEEKTVFVAPRYRSAKGGRARKLCEFSKQVADELGMPLLIGIVSNKRTKGKVEMYKRVFGDPAGAFFLYGAQTGMWAQETPVGAIGER